MFPKDPSQAASQAASQPASQAASQPARQPASQPASQAGVEYEFLHGVGVEYATYNLPRRWR